MGPADRSCHEGQARIATEKTRDKHDIVIVQEKLDGSNVGVALVDGQIVALGRAGYPAQTSPFEQHQLFADWVRKNEPRFRAVLNEGERLVGEWLAQAHGTRYELKHEPFVAFDLMVGTERLPYAGFCERLSVPGGGFYYPRILDYGPPCSVDKARLLLGEFGHHGATDPVEGAVWRVERNKLTGEGGRARVVDFLVKWVRPDKVDGKYLESVSGEPAVWNWRPE